MYIAARGLQGIHKWLGLIEQEGVAGVIYQNEATSVGIYLIHFLSSLERKYM